MEANNDSAIHFELRSEYLYAKLEAEKKRADDYEQQRAEALEIARTLPHHEACASRRPLCGICDLPVLSASGAFGTSHALRRSEKTCVTGGSSKTPNVVRTCDCCVGLLIEKLGGEK